MGCQFGALGACPVVLGGCPNPTGCWGHPNHRQLPWEVPETRDPTTARDIRRLHAVREARSRSHSRHHCAPAPRLTPHWARLVRRAVLRAAQRASCLASRGLIYSDPDLTRQRGLEGSNDVSRLHDVAAPKLQTMGGCYGPSFAADNSREWRWHVPKSYWRS